VAWQRESSGRRGPPVVGADKMALGAVRWRRQHAWTRPGGHDEDKGQAGGSLGGLKLKQRKMGAWARGYRMEGVRRGVRRAWGGRQCAWLTEVGGGRRSARCHTMRQGRGGGVGCCGPTGVGLARRTVYFSKAFQHIHIDLIKR
jgi:hypothetical protein